MTLVINDCYAIVFHNYSLTSIYIPNVSFVFYITIFVFYNRELYSIYSHLYLIFVYFVSIFLIYSVYSIVSCFYYIIAYLHSIIYIYIQSLFITIL